MKNIKDYLHLYLGCEAAIGYDPKGISGMRIDKIVDVGLSGAFTSNSDLEMFEDIKPILRPLSDMTEEELDKLIAIVYPDMQYKTEESVLTITDITINGLNNSSFDGATPAQCFEITRYLLSKHFDLFGLIDEGLAIDKTQNNKP